MVEKLNTIANKSESMKVIKIVSVIFSILLIYPVLVTAASDTNLIINPSFESGLTVPLNWTFVSQNENTPIWDNISYSGSKSVKISIPGITDIISGYPMSDLIPAEPLKYYNISAYKLVWSDEFDGTLDETKWEIAETANYPWLQCNTRDNAYAENGSLVLRIKQGACPNNNPSLPGYNYNTGLVTSKTTWQYGYFEARAKVSKGYTNSAFWTSGDNWAWPPEIDVYETAGYTTNPGIINFAYHWSDNGVHKEVDGIYPWGFDYSQDYHIYAVEWTPTYLAYFVDGVELYRATATSTMPIASVPMQIILSINKGWETMPTTLPQYHYIDYIRVYQKMSIFDLLGNRSNLEYTVGNMTGHKMGGD